MTSVIFVLILILQNGDKTLANSVREFETRRECMQERAKLIEERIPEFKQHQPGMKVALECVPVEPTEL